MNDFLILAFLNFQCKDNQPFSNIASLGRGLLFLLIRALLFIDSNRGLGKNFKWLTLNWAFSDQRVNQKDKTIWSNPIKNIFVLNFLNVL